VSTQPTAKDLWRRAERGWPASYPIAQAPNAPLAVALGALLVAVVTHGSVHDYARALFYAGLAAWGWEELSSGVNWFRRAVGVVGLLYVVVRVGQALGG
jgi:hypothetical protein